MPKMPKRRGLNSAADRFYDYIIVRREEVLRYAGAALVTGLIEFALRRMMPMNDSTLLIPYAARFALFFTLLKYWVYQEKGTGVFYTGRQLMIAVMLVVAAYMAVNWLTVLFASLTGRPALIAYLMRAVLEILFFAFYQFIIFKES